VLKSILIHRVYVRHSNEPHASALSYRPYRILHLFPPLECRNLNMTHAVSTFRVGSSPSRARDAAFSVGVHYWTALYLLARFQARLSTHPPCGPLLALLPNPALTCPPIFCATCTCALGSCPALPILVHFFSILGPSYSRSHSRSRSRSHSSCQELVCKPKQLVKD